MAQRNFPKLACKLMVGLLMILPLHVVVAQDLEKQYKRFRHQVDQLVRNEGQVNEHLVPTYIVFVQDRGVFATVDTFGQPLMRGVLDPTEWELGSLTKPVIAYLTELALESQDLNMDSPMCSILPDSLCWGNWNKVTIRQILDHKAGLPLVTEQMALQDKAVKDPYAAYDLNSLIADIQHIDPVPGKYGYSHLGYAALHWLFVSVGGINEISHTQLFLKHYGGFLTSWPDQLIIKGHSLSGQETPPWHPNALTTALGLNSDPYSLYHFLEHLSSYWPASEYTLTRKLKRELKEHDRDNTYKVLHGWFVFRSRDALVYFHSGHTGGHYVSAAFIPASDQYAIVFSNGAAGTGDLVLRVLDMLQRGKKY